MADHSLLIAAGQIEQMLGHAREALPNECCGLLVGRRNPVAIVTRLVPAANIHDTPDRCFTLDPATHFKVLKELRDSKDDIILGHYHSHPIGPAAPSPRDLAEASDLEMLWLVIASDSGEIGAFQLKSGDDGKIESFDPMTIIATPTQIP